MTINYSEIQKAICDIGRPDAAEEEAEYCPSCIIDLNAPEPASWWEELYPYLNQRTCEYYIPVSLNAEGRTYTTAELRNIKIPFSPFSYSYLRNGIRLALRHFEKMDDNNVIVAKMPLDELGRIPDATEFSATPKPHLYEDQNLWDHLGRFFVQKNFVDQNGEKFSVQEVDEELISRFSDITNPAALELFSYVKDYHLGTGIEPIKLLVAIPAYVFDQVPPNPMTAVQKAMSGNQQGEVPIPDKEEYNFVTEVELDGYTLVKDIKKLAVTFDLWSKYQSIFLQLQGGRIKQRSALSQEKQVNFYIKKYKRPLEIFADNIQTLFNENGYVLSENKKNTDVAEKVRITFSKPTETEPYSIQKVEAKYEGCEYKPLSSKFEVFMEAPQTQEVTLLNYIAKLPESMMVINYMQSTPWVDWIDTYTWPPTEVNLMSASKEMVDECIEVPPLITEEDDHLLWNSLDFSLKDMLSWWASQMNCKTLKEMARYDIMKELEDMVKQFQDMINSVLFIDVSAIREMFSLPIDFKAMRNKKKGMGAKAMLSEFFNRLDACNLAAFLFEILKCLFGGMSLEEMLRSIIMRTLADASKGKGVELLEYIYNSVPDAIPVSLSFNKQADAWIAQNNYSLSGEIKTGGAIKDRTRLYATARLGGFDKAPWDYYREEKQRLAEENNGAGPSTGQYLKWLAGAEGKKAGLIGQLGDSQTEPPPPPPLEDVIDIWIEEFIDSFADFEWLLETIKDFPGAELIKTAVAFFGCPHESVIMKFLNELKGSVNFGALIPCRPVGGEFFRLPSFDGFPKMAWKELLRALLMIIAKKILEILLGLLMAWVMKLLAQLSCAGLLALIKALANRGDPDSLLGAVGEAFCDDQKPKSSDPFDANDFNDGEPVGPDGPVQPMSGQQGGQFPPPAWPGVLPADGAMPIEESSTSSGLVGYENTEAQKTLFGLLDTLGVHGPDPEIIELTRDISAVTGRNEFKKAFVTRPEEQDPDFCALISSIVNDRHAKYNSVLGDPENVANFFSAIGNFLSPNQKELIRASIDDTVDDLPIDPSVCLTTEEKKNWIAQKKAYINNLCGNLPMTGYRPADFPDFPDGFPGPKGPIGPDGVPRDPDTGEPLTTPDGEPLDLDGLTDEEADDLGGPGPNDFAEEPTLADDWIEKLAEREQTNLEDTIDMFIQGPAGALGTAMEEAFKMTAPSCQYDPDTGEPVDPEEQGPSKSVLPPWPEEVTSMMDEAKKDIYNSINSSFLIDMQGSYHSLFNHLLADTWNAPYSVGSRFRPSHKTAVRHPFISPNAAHTEAQWQEKWDVVAEQRFNINRMMMKVFAPETDEEGTEIDDHVVAQFPTHVYPETVGVWMRNQLMSQIDPEADDPLTFATDMNKRGGGSYSITPTRYDREGNERDYNYKRRRWGISKKVTWTFNRQAVASPELTLKFRDNNNGLGGWKYGFNLKLVNYTHDDSGTQLAVPAYRLILDEYDSTNVPSGASWRVRGQAERDEETGEVEISGDYAVPSTIRAVRDRYMNKEVIIDPGNALLVLPEYESATTSELGQYNYPGIVFKNYIRGQYLQAGLSCGASDTHLAKDLFDGLNNFVYNKVIGFMINDPNAEDGIPECYKYGYVDDRLDREDYTYVDPSAPGYNKEDPETWEYDKDNSEKLLGISATQHPRVEFLDPEIHGGKYTRPKIYIHPPKYKGWLGIKQMIIPEEDNHEPARKQFLFIDDIVKIDKDLKEEIPIDIRLNDPRQCSAERAYDLLNEPSGHAGIHATVLLTTRTYVFEHLLKSLPMYSILKIDFKNNYDESVLASIVQDMEEGMSDTPRWGGRRGFFKRYRYWLFFLEQAVQTFERMILTDKLELTLTMSTLLDKLKEVRNSSTILNPSDVKWMKHVRTIEWDESGFISNIDYAYHRRIKGKKVYYPLSSSSSQEQESRLKKIIDSVMFYSFGKNFRSILAGETRNFAFRMRKKQRHFIKMCNKLHALHNSKDFAMHALQYIVADQLEFYAGKLRQISADNELAYSYKPKPYIDNLKKYFLGSSNTIITPFNGGTTEEEDNFRELLKEAGEAEEAPPMFDYGGAIKHVVHNPRTDNPVNYFSADENAVLLDSSPHGNFYIEKYLRIVEKEGTPDAVAARDILLKEVVNIEEFQSWLQQNESSITLGSDDVKISDVFGNATPIYDEEDPEKLIGYNGSIGIKFGVRLCFVPNSDYNAGLYWTRTESQIVGRDEKGNPLYGDVEVDSYQLESILKEKSFLFAEGGSFSEHNVTNIFPMASYERDIVDVPISQLKLNDDDFGEDLPCYIHELLKIPEMSLLFDFCLPVRRAASLMSVYCNYAFFPSIGEDPSERDAKNAPSPHEYWKSRILVHTKNRLRFLFVSNYRAVAWSTFVIRDDQKPRDRARKSLKEKLEGSKSSRGSRSAGWRIGRRIVPRPYDMYGEPEEPDDGVD